MTIQYIIELPGGEEVKITQVIDPTGSLGTPSAEVKDRPKQELQKVGTGKDDVLLPAEFAQHPMAALSGGGKNQENPGTGGGGNPEKPGTGGGGNPEKPGTGGGGNPEKPGTGGGGMYGGLTIVFGPVVLPASYPQSKEDTTSKQVKKATVANI